MRLKDYGVSGEAFELLYNENYDMLVTSPQPEAHKLDAYYKSENYISHTDAKHSVFEKIYQLVKDRMLSKKLQWIQNEKSEEVKLLDFGAGTGDFIVSAKEKGWKAIGIEPNQEARERAKEKNVELFEALDELKKNDFDVITLWHVLEHIPDIEEKIQRLKELLKDDGLLIIAVPNFKSFDAEYYQKYWAAYDVPRHLWHFSKKSIQKIFAKNQMNVSKVLHLPFDAYYVAMLSEKYRNKRTNYLNALRVAFLSNQKAKRTGEYSSLVYFIRKE